MGAPLRPRGSWRRSSAASLDEGEEGKEGGRVENRQLTQPLLLHLLVVVTATGTASTASSCLVPTCIAASSLLTTAAAVRPTSRGPPDPTAATGINVGSDNATDAAEEAPEPEGAAAAVARSDYSPSAAAAATASVGRGRWGRSAVSGVGRAAAVGPPRATAAAAASATLATPHYYFFHGLPPSPLSSSSSCHCTKLRPAACTHREYSATAANPKWGREQKPPTTPLQTLQEAPCGERTTTPRRRRGRPGALSPRASQRRVAAPIAVGGVRGGGEEGGDGDGLEEASIGTGLWRGLRRPGRERECCR